MADFKTGILLSMNKIVGSLCMYLHNDISELVIIHHIFHLLPRCVDNMYNFRLLGR